MRKVFYISSPERPAYRLRFDSRPTAIGEAVARGFQQARAGNPDVRRHAREEIVLRAKPLAVQSADPIQADLQDPQLAADDALDRVEAWWRSKGVSHLLDESATWRKKHADLLRERARYFQIDHFARRIIRSDLFLTGGKAR